MRVYSSLSIDKSISLGFLSLILAGTFLLWTLESNAPTPLPLIDAAFTSTSAVCVTGLSTISAHDLTIPSQLVLMSLIQLGGIGIMAAATSLLLIIGARINIRERLYLAGSFGIDSPQGMVRLLRLILGYTFAIEALGAAAIYPTCLANAESPAHALLFAAFHAVSAFCNAGFSIFPYDLQTFSTSLVLPGVVMILIVTGGLGFPAIMEIDRYMRGQRPFLSPYPKIVLSATAALIISGTVLLALAEWRYAFAHLPPWARVWNGLFGSITARTAGFSTVPFSGWSMGGIMLTMLLMLIGASPASTGGGLKTTTFVVLLWSALAEIRGEEDVNIFGRRIDHRTIRRAISMAFVYMFTLFLCSAFLLMFENHPLSSLVFEAVSALGTVGLSLGITPELSLPGKIVIILLMYWGRVGLLTFSYFIARHNRQGNVILPSVRVPIG